MTDPDPHTSSVVQERRKTPEPRRLVYLDNLKVFALLLGLFVHGNNFVSAADHVVLVSELSVNFRMATFFFIAGFFSILVIKKRPGLPFFKRRLVALGLPLLVGLALLNPLTLWLKARYRADFMALEGVPIGSPDDPFLLHLWFLVCLIVYVLLTPLLFRAARSRLVSSLADRLHRPRLIWLSPLAITLAVVVWTLAARWLVKEVNLDFLARSTLYYLPFFALGCLMFVHRSTMAVFHRVDLPTFALATALFVLGEVSADGSIMDKIGHFGSRAAFQCCITFALLWLFRRFFDVSSGATRLLSRALYTIYLLHYMILTILATVWIRFFPSGEVLAIAIASAAIAIGVLIHRFVVERYWVAALLLNGRPMPRPVEGDTMAGSILRN